MRESRVPAVVVGAADACGIGLVRSLAKGNVPVFVIETDADQPAMHSRFARGVTVPALSGRVLADALLALARSLDSRSVLFLTSDDAVRTVSEFRTDLERAYRFSLPSHQCLVSLMSKTSFQQFAERHGFPVPRSVTIGQTGHLSRLSNLTFPCIVKPAVKNTDYISCKFPRAYKVATRAEAEAVCRQVLPIIPDLVVQEWIEGPDTNIYFCLQYRANDGHAVCSFTGRKLSIWPPTVGVTTSCTAAPEVEPILQPLTQSFFQAASFVGMGSMEFKKDARSGQFLMIEPTIGRADLQEEVATLHGANIPLAAYLHEVGMTDVPAEKKSISVVWRGSWVHGTPTFDGDEAQSCGPRFLRYYDAYWRPSDPMPALVHARNLLRQAVHSIIQAIVVRSKWATSRSFSSSKS